MANLKNTITIPETRAEMIQSHSFKTYIYPQLFNLSKIGSRAIYENFSDLFGQSVKIDNLIGGILNVNKDFAKTVMQRRALGPFSYEAYQTIPTALDYNLTLDKVVYYKPINKNDVTKALEIEGNGLIKQFVPLMLQETVKNPDGTIKESTFYYDCWITKENVNLDLQSEDMIVIKKLTIKPNSIITLQNSNVGYVEVLGNFQAVMQDIISNQNTFLKDFKIPFLS